MTPPTPEHPNKNVGARVPARAGTEACPIPNAFFALGLRGNASPGAISPIPGQHIKMLLHTPTVSIDTIYV
jgi:hypothetical protein